MKFLKSILKKFKNKIKRKKKTSKNTVMSSSIVVIDKDKAKKRQVF